MKIDPAVPVIGPLFYRRSVRALASAVKKGDLPAVHGLAGIAATSPDAPACAIARDALGSLPSQDAIDVFCNEVLARGDPALDRIAISRGYAPAEPELRALFLYLTGQEEALCRCDPEAHHPVLARGYAAAPERIKARALRGALDPRRGRILAQALIGTDPVQRACTWSYSEWEVVFSRLVAGREWEELWQLVFSSPPSLAVTALHAMKTAGWRPEGDGRPIFDELVRDLPETWASPLPEKPLISLGNQDSRCLRLAFSRDGSLLGHRYLRRGRCRLAGIHRPAPHLVHDHRRIDQFPCIHAGQHLPGRRGGYRDAAWYWHSFRNCRLVVRSTGSPDLVSDHARGRDPRGRPAGRDDPHRWQDRKGARYTAKAIRPR